MYITKNIQHDILFVIAAAIFFIFTAGLAVKSDSASTSPTVIINA